MLQWYGWIADNDKTEFKKKLFYLRIHITYLKAKKKNLCFFSDPKSSK